MKKYTYILLAAAAVAGSCSKALEQELTVDDPAEETEYVFTLEASSEDDLTRTSYANDKTFSWNAGDAISVLFHKGSTNKFFTLTTSGTGKSVTFSGVIDGGYTIGASDKSSKKVALFPAADHSYTPGNEPVFNIPRVTDFSSTHFSANIPMAAVGDGNNQFTFKHIAGCYKVVYKDIDASVKKVMLSVTNQNNYAISGDFQLTTSDAALYRWSETWSSDADRKSLVYIENVVDGKATFYIPYSHNKESFRPTFVLTNADNGNCLKTSVAKTNLSGTYKADYGHLVVLPEISAPGKGTTNWVSNHGINWDLVETVVPGRVSDSNGGINEMKVTADSGNLYLLLSIKSSYLLNNASYDYSNFGKLYISDGSSTGSWSDWMWPLSHWQDEITGWLKTGNALSFTSVSGVTLDSAAHINGDTCYYEIAVPRAFVSTLRGTSADIGYTFDKSYSSGGSTGGDTTPRGYAPATGSGKSLFHITLPTFSETPSTAPSPGNITVTEASGEVLNPERGLYNQTSFYFNGSSIPGLSISSSHVEPLEFVLFYLTGYKDKDLDNTVLTAIETVFDNLRAAGKKAIVRVGYSSAHEDADKPWNASKDQMLSHIKALKPIFTANADIIYVMQAGFIGTYGEWYYTTDEFKYSVSGSTVQNFANHKAIVDALLDAVPAPIQVALRTPYYKRYYLNPTSISSWTPITAWGGTDANSRIGFYDDGFMADNGKDTGTFLDDTDWAMWNSQSAWLLVGGETAYQSSAPDPTYCGHDVALSRLAGGHVSYLNKNTSNKIMAYWISNGWLNDICKALGYRLVVNSANVTYSSLSSGSKLSYSFSIQNKGSATPIYPRPFKLVLVHNGTPTVLADFGDVRSLLPGAAATKFSGSVTLPQTVMQFDQLAIWLPDNSDKLRSNPAYSIRFANSDIDWANGFNIIYSF